MKKRQKEKWLQVIKKETITFKNKCRIANGIVLINLSKISFKYRNGFTACEKSHRKMD